MAEATVKGGPVGRTIHPTVVHMLEAAIDSAPDVEALVCGDVRLSYRRFGASVGAFARELQRRGARGERVAVVLPNSVEIVIAAFAVQAAGAQLSMLNPAYQARELEPILTDAAPRVVITDAEGYARHGSAMAVHAALPPIVVGAGGDDLVAADVDIALPRPLPEPDQPAALQYTGGTTGRSKGVVCTHRAWATNVAQRATLLPNSTDGERFLCMTPLFHAYAIASAMHPAVDCGGTLVILPRYRPERVLEAIARERITYLPALPTIYTGVLGHPEFANADLSSLRRCVSGAAPLPVEVLSRWERTVGVPVAEGYGLTEASAVLTYNPFEGLRKRGSVGVPLPATEIQIMDPNDGGTVLSRGEIGEVRARGPQLMSGYRGLPEETAETLRDGWLYTGDIGELDEDGYLFLRDRKKEMAIVGGYNVFPREIEEVLHTHPDVAEAAAVGVPDSYKGEVIRAYVARRTGVQVSEAELHAHCAAQLVKYKRPVSITFVDEIPKTPAGKIDRKRLRQEFVDDS